MRRDYVTFFTDGLRDYVELPDGLRYILGTLSVAKVLAGLVPTNEVRRVCDAFNEGKRPRVSVDLDSLEQILEENIRRARWASATSLIPGGSQDRVTREGSADPQPHPEPRMATNRTASFENFEGNQALVEDTLTTIMAAERKIDARVAEGKRFNHVAAKADLHKVASKLADIVSSVDLACDWVRADLENLSKSAHDIDSLFPER